MRLTPASAASGHIIASGELQRPARLQQAPLGGASLRWKATARNMLARAAEVPGQGLLYTATYAIRIAPPEIVLLVGDVQLQTPFGNPPPIARSKMMKNG